MVKVSPAFVDCWVAMLAASGHPHATISRMAIYRMNQLDPGQAAIAVKAYLAKQLAISPPQRLSQRFTTFKIMRTQLESFAQLIDQSGSPLPQLARTAFDLTASIPPNELLQAIDAYLADCR